MTIKIYMADSADYEISVEGANNYPDLGVVVKVTKAIQDYYDKKEFLLIGEKLGGLYETQKESQREERRTYF